MRKNYISYYGNVNEFGREFAKASLKASYSRIMGEGLVKDISKMQTAKGKAFVGLLGGYARGNLINMYSDFVDQMFDR